MNAGSPGIMPGTGIPKGRNGRPANMPGTGGMPNGTLMGNGGGNIPGRGGGNKPGGNIPGGGIGILGRLGGIM